MAWKPEEGDIWRGVVDDHGFFLVVGETLEVNISAAVMGLGSGVAWEPDAKRTKEVF